MKKETKVLDIEGNEVVSEIKPIRLAITLDDANNYMKTLGTILIGDDRLIPLQKHFVDMISANNEKSTQ